MRTSQALISSLVFPFLTACDSEQSALQLESLASATPRNVIFILTDDHRFDFMGFTDKVAWLETPNLDRLVRAPISQTLTSLPRYARLPAHRFLLASIRTLIL
jgi:hypothetical protein